MTPYVLFFNARAEKWGGAWNDTDPHLNQWVLGVFDEPGGYRTERDIDCSVRVLAASPDLEVMVTTLRSLMSVEAPTP